MKTNEIKKEVRKGYAKIAKHGARCCTPTTSCCGGAETAPSTSKGIGYSDEDFRGVPEGANLGLGCGNPIALASLEKGETVLDLGSGGGFDCFLAAKKVGRTGKVIGVDMTAEMIDKARANAEKGNYTNVEFRLGEIEHLPAGDSSIDVVISNCVINLSVDKRQVFKEAFRVLKPGGRLMVSDLVLRKELAPAITQSVRAYVGCLAGALLKDNYLNHIRDAGFKDVRVKSETAFPVDCLQNDETAKAIMSGLKMSRAQIKDTLQKVLSMSVSARKPKRA